MNKLTYEGPKIIAVDFDGTLCENKYPDIGEPNVDLISYLRLARCMGVKVILWTCRSKKRLKQAVKWCSDHDLYFDAINKNVKEAVKAYGGDSRKIYADMYIDDKNCTNLQITSFKLLGRSVRKHEQKNSQENK